MMAPSTLQLAQRRTFDMHRVAIMPQTTVRKDHHQCIGFGFAIAQSAVIGDLLLIDLV
jgi:hypothetical protein